MKSSIAKRFALALLAGAALAGGAQAQGIAAYREDPGTALTRHLKSLSDDPRSLYALIGAGQAALKLGDAQAAATFFARAEEVAPRDGRVKAGLGSAFVQMEQPQPALRFFSEASGLGLDESQFAGDRGLAHDLLGDTRQAQRDYRTALARGKDPEIERRLALSLAIGGDKAGAIAAIGDQLARKDRAAWRTRAFILALSGDTAGATDAVQAVMPAQASAMQPFLARLATLDPASRASAVHFGHMPGGARPIQMANAAPANLPPTARIESRPLPVGTRTAIASEPIASRRAETLAARPPIVSASPSLEPGRRAITMPLTSDPAPATAANVPARSPVAAPPLSVPAATPPAVSVIRTVSPPASSASSTPTPTVSTAPPEPFGPPASVIPSTAQPTTAPVRAPIQTVALPESTIAPPPAPITVTLAPASTSAPASTPLLTPAAASTPAARKPLEFAEVVAAVRALPDAAPPVRPAAAASVAKADPPAGKPETADAGKARHWVQIASAPDSLVTSEYRRLKRKHSGLLADKDGYRAPMGKSNRVLVGPFASAGAATKFVADLKDNSLTAIAWTSADGQEIEKLSGT